MAQKDGARHLLFLDENQGGWTVSWLLDGSENPKVLITCAGQTRPHADSFSDAIFCCIFDWPGEDKYEISMGGTFSPLKNGELEMLQRRFPEKFPLTYNGFFCLGKSHRFDAGTFTSTITIEDDVQDDRSGIFLCQGGGAGMLLCQAKNEEIAHGGAQELIDQIGDLSEHCDWMVEPLWSIRPI